MRRLQITAIGAPADVLQLVEFEAPAPGPGQVLVEVEAATTTPRTSFTSAASTSSARSRRLTSEGKASGGSWLSAPARTSHWLARGCCFCRLTATAPGPAI